MAELGKNSVLSCEDMAFLESITRDVVEASRVYPGQKIGKRVNEFDYVLIRPGGRDCYPAYWVRDVAMSSESGLVSDEELRNAITLTAKTQQENDWMTPSGSRVPHGAIVDHVSLDGKAIFFPGTIDDYENQGGHWGKRPSLDNHFYFIDMVWRYLNSTGDIGILTQNMNSRTLLERLELAFQVPQTDEHTGLVCCDETNRGVTFGYVDSIVHTGKLLFCSLLKYQAANQLESLFSLVNESRKANHFLQISRQVKQSINNVFQFVDGLPAASTGTSAQPDVWSGAFGVYIDAFEQTNADHICYALRDGYLAGTIAYKGNIRHVRTTDDFNEMTAWEQTVGVHPKNRYQNGAYWNTATGWVCYAIAQVDKSAAANLAREYVAELREGDFRKGTEFGSPWECIHSDGYRQNAVYLASVTCPLAALKRLSY